MPTYVSCDSDVWHVQSILAAAAVPRARSYGCDPPLELEASERASDQAGWQHVALAAAAAAAAHRCSSFCFRNHRPVTQPCVRGENRKIIA